MVNADDLLAHALTVEHRDIHQRSFGFLLSDLLRLNPPLLELLHPRDAQLAG